MKTKIISSKDLGVQCWSVDRIVKCDCTLCERHRTCKYLVKGVYPKPDPGQLYQTQLELLKLRSEIRKIIKKDRETLPIG